MTAIVNNEQEEEAFLQRTKEFALLHKVYIGVTYKLIEPVQKNKLVLVTKGGEIGINYNKAHPVPGIVSVIYVFFLMPFFKLKIYIVGTSTCWTERTTIH